MGETHYPQTSVTAIGTYNACIPKNGGKCIPIPFDFSGGVTDIKFDYERMTQQGQIAYCQTIWIDNADNPVAATVTIEQTNQRIVAPPNSQGYYACFMNTIRFSIHSDSGGKIQVQLSNLPIPTSVWRVV